MLAPLGFVSRAAMSSDEAIVQCGTWFDLPASSQYTFLHSIHSNTDGASKASKNPSPSSGGQQTEVNGVTGPVSAASTTVVSADSHSNPLIESQVSHAGTDFPINHDYLLLKKLSGKPPSLQESIHVSNEEGLTTRVPSRPPLTAANLDTQERPMTALPSSDSAVASWLASGLNEHPLGAVDWSQLVASDPLAAEIEAATFVGPHGRARERR
jgi:hypothetical protein